MNTNQQSEGRRPGIPVPAMKLQPTRTGTAWRTRELLHWSNGSQRRQDG